MKNYYYLMSLITCWLVCAAAIQAQPLSKAKTVSEVENRLVYAEGANPDIRGNGLVTFNTGAQQTQKVLHEWKENRFILSGAAANGDYYGYFCDYQSVGGADPVGLGKVNIRTGEIKIIKDWKGVTVKFQDMTYDYSTKTMFALGYEAEKTWIYKIDLTTGDFVKGELLRTQQAVPVVFTTLAATYDGRLYGIGRDGILYKIDKETAIVTSILDLEVETGFSQSMEFDHTDESLYWASSEYYGYGTGGEINELYKIDIEKKTCKSLGKIGLRLVGLYIPYVIDGFDVPGLVTDLKVTPGSEGKLEAKITWKNPAKTHGGDPLTGDVSVVLEKDGKMINSLIGKAGAEMSWTDTEVTKGEHIYTVKVSNNIGEGLRNDIDAFVGPDVPNQVSDLAISIGNECKSIKLAWTVPQKGAHNGFYDKSNVKFKITRYPDEEVIKEDFTGTSFEDNTTTRLGAYYYGITATNVAGENKEYITKNTVIAGNPVALPYTFGFEDRDMTANNWSIYDMNKDYVTWYVGSGFGMGVFGDAMPAIEYLSIDTKLDADEWLISPPFNFVAGKDYMVSFDTRSSGIDELTIAFGELNAPESQTQILKSGLFTKDSKTSHLFENQLFQLPRAEGIRCIGINVVTAYGQSGMLQITNFKVMEGTGIESSFTGEQPKLLLSDNRLEIEGDFKNAVIYDAAGIQIASLSTDDAQAYTENWKPGIYIVKITGVNSVDTQKVMIK